MPRYVFQIIDKCFQDASHIDVDSDVGTLKGRKYKIFQFNFCYSMIICDYFGIKAFALTGR